jgi:glycerophosphoryl diester phosphodiesterase
MKSPSSNDQNLPQDNRSKQFSEFYTWAWKHLREIAKPAIAFELWFTLIYMIVFAPVSAWLLNWLVASSGQVVISNHDLVTFFISARGIVFLLLNVGFLLALVFAEQVGLLVIAMASALNRSISVSIALWEKISLIPKLIRLGLIQAACYAALCVPFAAGLAVTYRILLGAKDINYYMGAKPWEWWTALIIGALLGAAYLVLALWLFVRWLFAVPNLVFERSAPTKAMKKSWQRTRGCFWKLVLTLGVWWIFVLMTSLVTIWLIRAAASQLLSPEELNLTVVLPTVIVASAVSAIVNLAVLILGKTGHTLLMVRYYLDSAELPTKLERAVAAPLGITPAGLRRLGWAGAAFACLVAVSAGAVFVERLDVNRTIAVTAHRGSSLKAPENTLSAIRQAAADGADYAEIDVQSTADGVVVLIHDADLMRMASVKMRIKDTKYDELKNIDIGSWFAPEFKNERIATLEEAIEAARGRIRLNIELKFNQPDPPLAERVANIIRNKGFASECVVSSMDYQALMEIERLLPEIKTGLIVFRALGKLQKIETDFMCLYFGLAKPQLVKRLRRREKEIHVWTVNDLQSALSMIEVGVDNILTDSPRDLRDLLDAWNELADTEKLALMLRHLFKATPRMAPTES